MPRALLTAALLAASPAHTESRRVEMTLAQAVSLAVTQGRSVRAAILQREQSRNGLRIADHQFKPFLDVDAGADAAGRQGVPSTRSLGAGASLRLALRTGGSLTYDLRTSATELADRGGTRAASHGLLLSQPLFLGRGRVATVNQDLQRLGDSGASLSLEAVVSDLIDGTVFAYRDLLAAGEQVSIAERSLATARELAENTAALIEVGRLPAVEKIQSETDIANRELSLLVSQNGLAQAKLALVSALDLDLDTEVVPTDGIRVERREVDPGEALRTLLARSPEYRALQLQVEQAQLGLLAAENEQRLDVLASAGLGLDRDGPAGDLGWTRDWKVGLTLRRVLFDPGRDVALVSARLSLAEARLALAKAEDTLRIDLRQRLRNLEVAWRQLALATRARELSAMQLDIEREKLNAGRSASFQVVRFQSDLDAARTGELVASITYANELTRLDRALGRTLEAWNIDLSGLGAGREAR